MIIISDKNIHNLVYIYRNMKETISNSYIFKLINKTTLFSKEYTVEDTYFLEGYYSFDFYDSTLQNGEYEYELIDEEGTIVSKGLIDFGEYNSGVDVKVFDQTIKYNMYENKNM